MPIEKLTCKNCSHVNTPYRSTCENCKAHLRDRVVNLDLWATIGKIIEEPTAAFKQIVYSENKNFIFFLLFFISIKNLIYVRFLSVPFVSGDEITTSFLLSFFIVFLFTIVIFLLYSVIEKYLLKKFNLPLRFKDVLAANIYCFTPVTLSLFSVFPVEVIVLGGDLFSNNPYAFQVKPTISYFLIGFELIAFSWSIFLLIIKGNYFTNHKLVSFFSSALFYISFLMILFVASTLIFKL